MKDKSLTLLRDNQKLYDEHKCITFGVNISNDNGKKFLQPASKWNQLTTSGRVKAHNNAFGALVGHKHNLIVIDIDIPKDGEVDGRQVWDSLCKMFGLPATVVVETPSGGAHYYFRPSEALSGAPKIVRKDYNLNGNISPVSIDCLLNNCFITGAGSENPVYGTTYKFREGCEMGKVDIAPVPEWVEDLCFCARIVDEGEGSLNFEFDDPEDALEPEGRSKTIEEEHCFSVDEFKEFLNQIDILARPYDTWRDVCFSLYNIFREPDRSALIHYFSALCPTKYKKGEVELFIRGIVRRECGYKFTNLLELAKAHKLKRAHKYLEELIGRRDLKAKFSDIEVSTSYETSIESKSSMFDLFGFIRGLNAKDLFEDEYVKLLLSELSKVCCYMVLHNMFCTKHGGYDNFKLGPDIPAIILHFLRLKGDMVVGVDISLWAWMKTNINLIPYYERLTFEPCPPTIEPVQTERRALNAWQGFKARLLPENEVNISECEQLLFHLKNVWCNKSGADYDFLIGSYFGEMFRTPHEKRGTAVNLVSNQGAGKGIVIDDFLIKYVFGEHMSTSMTGLGKATQRFNAVLMNKLFISINELPSFDANRRDVFDTLKALITDVRIQVEIKNGPVMEYPNFTRYILCTNNEFSLNIEPSDRRYFILRCSDEYIGNVKYFTNLAKSMTQKCADHFFSYCYYYKSIANPRRAPMTALKSEMISTFVAPPVRFVLYLADVVQRISDSDEKYSDPEDAMENSLAAVLRGSDSGLIKFSQLYEIYGEWCAIEGETKVSSNKFGRMIASYAPKVRRMDALYVNIRQIKTLN